MYRFLTTDDTSKRKQIDVYALGHIVMAAICALLLSATFSSNAMAQRGDDERPFVIGAGEAGEPVILRRLEPKHIWLGILHNDIWVTGGSFFTSPHHAIKVNNGSKFSSKVRVQGLRGQVVLFEYDVQIAFGTTQQVLDPSRLFEMHEKGESLPTAILISSNVDMTVEGLVRNFRGNTGLRDIGVLGEYNSTLVASTRSVHNLNFNSIDCRDWNNNERNCLTPTETNDWEMFVND